MSDDQPIMLDLVEYEPSSRADKIVSKANQEYCGVGEAGQYNFHCLSLRSQGKARRHHIAVGQVYAITIAGKRTVLETPWSRWGIRAQEIRLLIEGKCESWADDYLKPDGPKYFKNAPDYEPPEIIEPRKKRDAGEGDYSLMIGMAIAVATIAFFLWL